MAEAQSMDAFGPVSVDYFTGRRVESVEAGHDPGEWAIYFEGGGIIRNYESEVPTPTQIIGAALNHCIFDGTNKVTRLLFGLEEIVLNPIQYSIEDPVYTKGTEVYAQRSDWNMRDLGTPPDPSGDRVADGPDEG